MPGTRPVITAVRTAHTVEKNRGRLETRTWTACSLLSESSDWPSLQQVFKVERRRVQLRTGETHLAISYGVTRLTATEAPASRLLALNRGHGGIENGLHSRRDVTLHEDAGRTKTTAFGHIMATLNHLVIGLTLGHKWTNLAKARRYYDAHPELALQLLLARPKRTL